MKTYLVGGAVRDLLTGNHPADRDYLVVTDEDSLLARFPRAIPVGRDVPSYIIAGCEFALPRGETIDLDLARRDLTVNAMAVDETGELFAHPRAVEDLAGKILRPASDAAFLDDPARVFRAARFASRLPDFALTDDLLAAMREVAGSGLLEAVAPERVGTELRKALATPRPGRFLEVLDRTNALGPWFAELSGASSVPAGPLPYHEGDVLRHTIDVMNGLAGDPTAVYMALAHDLGKAATPPDKWPRHHNHDRVGEGLAVALGERLRLPSKLVRAGALAARWHMVGGNYDILRPGTKVDLLSALDGGGVLEPFFAMVAADGETDFTKRARADLACMKAVRLPEKMRNLGEKSGQTLRSMRGMALARGC